MEVSSNSQVLVVMVPLPCQSHLNQLLHLSTVIAAHGLPVHYLGTAIHNRQARLRHGPNPNSISLIQFHDLPSPPIHAPDPDPFAPSKTPMHLLPATIAYMSLRDPIKTFVQEKSLHARRVVIIYDRMLGDTAENAAVFPNVEAYAFNCLSAFNLFHILWEAVGKPFEVPGALKSLPPMAELIPCAASLEFIASRSIQNRAGDIHNTIRLIDGDYIDLFSREEISGNKQQWALQPFLAVDKSSPTVGNGCKHKCLEWLNKQPPGSVIFVSFGTTVSLTDEEALEIARGLEFSGEKFLWVLRDADRADIFSREGRRIALPEGFEERVRERGMVVREWAPQVEILRHGSTGGFMTHCGWNSCMESAAAGVAVAAWPMHSDQAVNAIFLTEVLKVGIGVRDWGKREELVSAEVVRSAVERLMATEEGDAVRRRAAELGGEIRRAAESGGEISREIERFIGHITR